MRSLHPVTLNVTIPKRNTLAFLVSRIHPIDLLLSKAAASPVSSWIPLPEAL